ncbi:TonB-dependent receptor [Catenovulum sp. 2E275]|uniref:TonB-dependent receptor n=1 Tax=Catenovulum sp. 2E275 TaxID=2980497 RepID=UPI0021D04D1A|nr:TonB-dependent receptor [Catenovulum sp. 2E275]MCU4675980.1 TonB-dependent receptor [Catenovulum sp. 2E275]
MKLLKTNISSLILSLSAAIYSFTSAAADAGKINFNITETRAELSLLQFASQAKLPFFISYELVNGVKTNPLVGEYTLSEAVSVLFNQTKLTGVIEHSGRFVLKKSQPLPQIELTSNNENTHIIEHKPEKEQVETIQVVGLNNDLPNYLQVKQVTEEVQERIGRSQISAQPAKNLTDNLQKSVGISIARSIGEGGDVSVRGFGPDYNVTTVNGRTIATSKESRNFDFRILPSDFVKNIDIVKSAPADLSAGSIGANIDITTSRPFDYDGLHIDSRFGLNTSELRPEYGTHFSTLFSNTFFDNQIGFMFGVLQDRSLYRVDRYTTQRLAQSNILPENLQYPVLNTEGETVDVETLRRPLRMIFDVQNGEKRRETINSVLQWKNATSGLHTLDLIYARYRRDSFSSGVQIPGQSPNYKNVVVDKNSTLVQADIFDNNLDAVFEQQVEDVETLALGYNIKFNWAGWWYNFDMSHSTASAYETLNALIPHYVGGENKIIHLDFSQSDILSATTNIPLGDRTQIAAHWNGRLDYYLKDEVNEIKLDSRYLFDEGFVEELNFGIAYFARDKSHDQYKWNDDYQCAPCGGLIDLPNYLFKVVEYPNFLENAGGSRPNRWLMLTDVEAYNLKIQNIMEEQGIVPDGEKWNQTLFDPSASYQNHEQNLSLYSKLNFTGEVEQFDWRASIGARYLTFKNISDGFIQQIERIDIDPNSSDQELRLKLSYSEPQPAQAKSNSYYFLPSANLALNFHNGYHLKAAAARVISFPKIEELGINKKFTSDDSGTVLLSGGNPNLKPYSATQYDLALEYYADKGHAYSLAFFHKNIDTFISTSSFERPFQGEVSDEVKQRREQIVELVNTSENISGGSILGVEFSSRFNLVQWCSVCESFTTEFNYTQIINNKINSDPIDLVAVKEPENIIEGLSESAFNFNLDINFGGFFSFFSYSWRSDYLHARQGIRTGGIPEHTEASGQLDGRLGFKFNQKFEVFLDAFNLTRSAHLEYADVRSRVTHFEDTGISYHLGLRKRW